MAKAKVYSQEDLLLFKIQLDPLVDEFKNLPCEMRTRAKAENWAHSKVWEDELKVILNKRCPVKTPALTLLSLIEEHIL